MVNKISFKNKLYLYTLILNFLLLLGLTITFYYYNTNSLKRNTYDNIQGNTSLLLKDLENKLSDCDNILKGLLNDSTLMHTAQKLEPSDINYFVTDVPTSSYLQSTFHSLLVSLNSTGTIGYISPYYDNIAVSYDKGRLAFSPKDSLSEIDDLSDTINTINYVKYELPHISYYASTNSVLTVVRSVRNTYNQYGVLTYDIETSFFDEMLHSFEVPENYSLSLFDEHNNLVYSTSNQIEKSGLQKALTKAIRQDNAIFNINSSTLSCFEKSELTGWTFVLTTSLTGYMESTEQLLFISALLFLVLFIIHSSFLYFVLHRLTNPLKQLAESLSSLKQGENITIPSNTEADEISVLTNAVQGFLKQIYNQNQRLTDMKELTLQAHYDAMEAQLNPHFLYNTLSVISMTSLTSGCPVVSQMSNELANLLRYSLSNTGQSVALSNEIENIKSYLYIMKMRYEDTLVYTWNLDPTLDSTLVPKLILQPLVENCFQHGFQQTENEILPPWTIDISSYQMKDYWYVKIKNNGAPFDLNTKEKLYDKVKQFQTSEYPVKDSTFRQGYGLENTILRLNICYNNVAIFEVCNENDHTTSIIIGGPL